MPPLHFLDSPACMAPGHPGRPALLLALTASPMPKTHLWAAGWAPGRWGGVFVQPATDVLGLRAWEDAWEGVLKDNSHPWAMFELEKIMRMLLAGSGLAFDILASPHIAHLHGLEAHFGQTLLTHLLQNRIFSHHLALLPPHWPPHPTPQALWRLRSALTGALLAKTHAVSTSWEHLITALEPAWALPLSQWARGEPIPKDLGPHILRQLRLALELGQKTWSSQPTGYDEANRLLVTLRQQACAPPTA